MIFRRYNLAVGVAFGIVLVIDRTGTNVDTHDVAKLSFADPLNSSRTDRKVDQILIVLIRLRSFQKGRQKQKHPSSTTPKFYKNEYSARHLNPTFLYGGFSI